MHIDVSSVNTVIRWVIASVNLIISLWSVIWFVAFAKDYLKHQTNGPTLALIVSFIARANFHGYLATGFIYLASQYTHPILTLVFLLWGLLSGLLILVAYTGLQVKFGKNEN